MIESKDATSAAILISTSTFGADRSSVDRLARRGIRCTLNPHGRTLTEDEACLLLSDKDGLIAGVEPLTARVLAGAPHLRVISRVGSGLDNVDLAAAARNSIQVFTTPEATVGPVAEITIGGILALLRHIPFMSRELHDGRWTRKMGLLLSSRRVGVVGMGRIGRRVIELLLAFGADVAVSDPAGDRAWAASCEISLMSLPELLRRSDIVTLHANAQPSGRAIVGTEELALMPRGACIVNVARGSLVDESALAAALSSGHLAGAYLDTFVHEPYRAGPLLGLPNVLLTPHAGTFTSESRAQMEREAVDNLLRGLTTGRGTAR